MKNLLKLLAKYLFLFVVGGVIYLGIELAWRWETHWTMGILGGICFIELGLINELLSWKTTLLKQALIGSVLVTINEFISGLILNIWLGWDIWDYSNLPFNIMGQICLLFSILWIFISIIGILVDDYLRYRYFNEQYPVYKLGILSKIFKKTTWVPFKPRPLKSI